MPYFGTDANLAAILQVRRYWLQPVLDEPIPARLQQAGEEVDRLFEARHWELAALMRTLD